RSPSRPTHGSGREAEVAICLLVRHGRTEANASGVLAGWTPGLALDATGREQASAVASRLSGTGVVAVVTSPLHRCRETAEVLVDGIPADARPPVRTDERLAEARYGAWTGRRLEDLAREDLWRQVQDRPS